jgi:hypothetical protein
LPYVLFHEAEKACKPSFVTASTFYGIDFDVLQSLAGIEDTDAALLFVLQEDKLKEMAVILASDPSYKGTNADYISEDLYHKSDFELHCLCQDKEVSIRQFFISSFFRGW